MQDAPLFELQDVSKTFPPARPYFPFGRKRSEIRAVSNVSLQINHGEVFGVIGESGSGKSTLGFLMGGIERPSSGSIMFCGKALDAMDRRDRNRFCRTTQLVFQDSASALNPRRKVRAALRTHCVWRAFLGCNGTVQSSRSYIWSAFPMNTVSVIRISFQAGNGKGWESRVLWQWSRAY